MPVKNLHTRLRLEEHVDRLAHDHPPIPLDSVDFTVRRARAAAAPR